MGEDQTKPETEIEDLKARVADLEAENAVLRQECAMRGEQIVEMDREFRALARQIPASS